MALLLALLESKAGDVPANNYKNDYEQWIGVQAQPAPPAAPVPPLHPERVELALTRLYSVLLYHMRLGTAESKTFGQVLATLMSYTAIPSPPPKGPITALRDYLRTEMLKEYADLKLIYP